MGPLGTEFKQKRDGLSQIQFRKTINARLGDLGGGLNGLFKGWSVGPERRGVKRGGRVAVDVQLGSRNHVSEWTGARYMIKVKNTKETRKINR